MPLPRIRSPWLILAALSAALAATLAQPARAGDAASRRGGAARTNSEGVLTWQHCVNLSWKASTSDDVIGYNVYRADMPKGPYWKINPVLDPSTLYSDTSVAEGKTYYYVTTAVSSNRKQSVHSNRVKIVIP
jgi:hypothetical protein